MKAGECALILAPTGQDAQLIASCLAIDSIASKVVHSVESVTTHIRENLAAVIIMAEEAVPYNGIALLNEALAAQEPWSDVPIILMTSGGETTIATLRNMKAFSPAGNFTLLERPFRRITLQSAVQVAVRARRKQHDVKVLLNEQMAATRIRDEFISIASHELKTPLTSLKLQAQLSLRKIDRGDQSVFTPEATKKLVESMVKQIDRLAHLVEDMLDTSRINIGKLVLQVTAFDLTKLVQETVERIAPQLEAAGCKTHVTLDAPVNGHWDRYRIEQILNNLISNAIRYSPGKPIHITVSNIDSNAVIVVRDEGQGIPLENQERIFQRFERAVSSSDISGLGLGLYICRTITEAHQGTIRVSSTVGEGTSFIVVLPKARLLQNDVPVLENAAS